MVLYFSATGNTEFIAQEIAARLGDSCINLLRSFGYKVSERRISIDEIIAAQDAGKLLEVFGTGTAAVISPVGELNAHGKKMTIGDGSIGKLSQKLYDTLTGIQWGTVEDTFDWTVRI